MNNDSISFFASMSQNEATKAMLEKIEEQGKIIQKYERFLEEFSLHVVKEDYMPLLSGLPHKRELEVYEAVDCLRRDFQDETIKQVDMVAEKYDRQLDSLLYCLKHKKNHLFHTNKMCDIFKEVRKLWTELGIDFDKRKTTKT